jgi:hypothetical protein
MKIGETLRPSLVITEASTKEQLMRDAEQRARNENDRRLETERTAKISQACLEASQLASVMVKPTSDRKTIQPGETIDFISEWLPIVNNDDGSVLEARLHQRTKLIVLSSTGGGTKLLRTWGDYFDGKYANLWLDFRLAKRVENISVYSNQADATLRFSEGDIRITSCIDGVVTDIEPGTEGWDDMELVIKSLHEAVF